jgi:hypothetical protein
VEHPEAAQPSGQELPHDYVIDPDIASGHVLQNPIQGENALAEEEQRGGEVDPRQGNFIQQAHGVQRAGRPAFGRLVEEAVHVEVDDLFAMPLPPRGCR